MKKCRFCGQLFKRHLKLSKEYRSLCPYCIIRLEMVWWSGGSKKKAEQIINLTNEEIDTSMKGLASLIGESMLTTEDLYKAVQGLAESDYNG